MSGDGRCKAEDDDDDDEPYFFYFSVHLYSSLYFLFYEKLNA